VQEPESPPLSAASFQDAEPSVPEDEDEEEVDEHKSSTTEFDGTVKVVELVADHVREPTMRPCRALALTPPNAVSHRPSRWGISYGGGWGRWSQRCENISRRKSFALSVLSCSIEMVAPLATLASLTHVSGCIWRRVGDWWQRDGTERCRW
jgi:hypothetical protein